MSRAELLELRITPAYRYETYPFESVRCVSTEGPLEVGVLHETFLVDSLPDDLIGSLVAVL